MHFKGCYKIKNDNDFLNFINNLENFENNIEDFYKFLNNCESKFNYGYIDLDFQPRSEISFNENVKRIVGKVKRSFNV